MSPSKKKNKDKKKSKSSKSVLEPARAKVNPIPRHSDGVIPHLVVSDAKAALDFYQKAFGAEVICAHPAPDGKRIMHGEIAIGKQRVYLADEFPDWGQAPRNPKAIGGTSVTLHQYVNNCDKALARAEKAGATVTMPATDMFWGDRYGKVLDPFGHEWAFASRYAKLSAKQMEAAAAAAFAQPPA